MIAVDHYKVIIITKTQYIIIIYTVIAPNTGPYNIDINAVKYAVTVSILWF